MHKQEENSENLSITVVNHEQEHQVTTHTEVAEVGCHRQLRVRGNPEDLEKQE